MPPTAAPFSSQDFDAVVVSNGHYSEPNTPDIPGMGSFPGIQLHSHNYRDPEAFRGKSVLVIGASNSGLDISREVAEVASKVYLAARDCKGSTITPPDAGGEASDGGRGESDDSASDPCQRQQEAMISRTPVPLGLTSDGFAIFEDGGRLGPLDAIIYCTGYRY